MHDFDVGDLEPPATERQRAERPFLDQSNDLARVGHEVVRQFASCKTPDVRNVKIVRGEKDTDSDHLEGQNLCGLLGRRTAHWHLYRMR